jgi:CRISPR-associated protein Csb2
VHVGSIRRVLVTSFGDLVDEVGWARRALNGIELVDEKTAAPVAMLALLPSTEAHVSRYTSARSSWATVTPILLPGFDDPGHLRRRSRDDGRNGTTAASRQAVEPHRRTHSQGHHPGGFLR